MRVLALVAILSGLVAVGCGAAPLGPIVRDGRAGLNFEAIEVDPSVRAHVAHVEMGSTRGSREAEADPAPTWLAERMRRSRTPGLSIAVIDGGAIQWAHGYGVAPGGEMPITPRTLFQAASMSKVVTAVAALRLVDAGELSLDEDVNDRLVSWKVPECAETRERKVTLRRVLTHSAGLTVHGFRGYAPGERVPTLPQILDGAPPANSPPIRVDLVPGSKQRYAGGGFVVLQQLLVDVSKKPFARTMHDLVLEPFGMTESTFAHPLPPELETRAARAHDADGSLLRGGSYAYPEQAAAGLWTTPSDLARFALEVARASHGESSLLREETALAIVTRQYGDYGLGAEVRGDGDARSFGHAGSNMGFRGAFVVFPARGQGAAVMTNGEGGGTLVREVLHAIAEEYNWPKWESGGDRSAWLSDAPWDIDGPSSDDATPNRQLAMVDELRDAASCR
jgi:CubicO group peptidase (beta-lactamase class C family)